MEQKQKWQGAPVPWWAWTIFIGWYVFYHVTGPLWKWLCILGYFPHFQTGKFPPGYGW